MRSGDMIPNRHSKIDYKAVMYITRVNSKTSICVVVFVVAPINHVDGTKIFLIIVHF